MITVRCPACDAAYHLDEAKLADGGRKLKCARCKVVWLAQAPAVDAAPSAEVAADEIPVTQPLPPEAPAENGEAPEREETSAEGDASALDEVPQAYPVEEVIPMGGRLGSWRQRVRGVNAWRSGALGLILLGVLTGGGVVALKLMPQMEAPEVADELAVPEVARSKVIQPPEGLVLHNVRDEVGKVEDGQGGVALTVRGLLANTTSHSLVVPPLQLELLGDDGQVADMWPVNGVDGTMPAGAEQAWTVSLSAPDMSRIRGWRVVFVEGARPEAR